MAYSLSSTDKEALSGIYHLSAQNVIAALLHISHDQHSIILFESIHYPRSEMMTESMTRLINYPQSLDDFHPFCILFRKVR